MSRRALQLVNAVVAVLTIALGSMQLVFGIQSPVYASAGLPTHALLDSNLRFFGGMGLGLGLILLWILPTIERRTDLFRAVWICAFLGGVGRLFSLFLVGPLPLPFVAFTALEVVGAPVLVVWQKRVADAWPPGRGP